MTDLRTSYLGLQLRSPIVASAGPLTGDPTTARRLEEAGVAAIVLPSLFEEDIIDEEVEPNLTSERGSEAFRDALEYSPRFPEYESVVDQYQASISELKEALKIPVIASLNATTGGGWIRYAQLLANAGADAIELNVYRVATDPERDAAGVESDDLRLIADVVAAVDLQVAVKLSPYYTALANFARRAVGAGANGLVLFNRFYQPDVELDALGVIPRLDLSHSGELRLPLRWIAILRAILGPKVSLAATSGIHWGTDVVKAIMVGANVAMMTSSLLLNGPEHAAVVEGELRSWLSEHDYASVDDLRGSVGYATSADPAAFERANYVRSLHSWTTPNGTPTAHLGG